MPVHYTMSTETCPQALLDNELKQVNPICLDILYRRGFTTAARMREVLFPDIKLALRPLDCLDIQPALAVLAEAVRRKIPVVVYRDYDVDGITAGAVAVSCLRELGVPTEHYANDREVDGFGICANGIDKILARWPEAKIILTVDNGMTGAEAIEYACGKGLTVIVTDHHLPGDQFPAAAAAVVDLKRDGETYPYHDLCGCGLIFRVMLDLYRFLKRDPTPVFNQLDLVALATVADVVPLLGENRALVQAGIRRIESAQRPFFKAVAKLFDVTEVTAHHTISFLFAPLLNSLSRMGEDTGLAVEALLTNDEQFAALQAANLKALNEKRKELTKAAVEKAQGMIHVDHLPYGIVLYDETFPEGIVGIIAGRIKEKFNRPTIVLTKAKDGTLKGSGRCIDQMKLNLALDTLAPLLLTHGGHEKAAGLSLKEDLLEAFRAAFEEYAGKELEGKDIRRKVEISAVLTENTLTEQLVRDLKILEPYGEGFQAPLFGLIAQPKEIKYIGSDNQHVKMSSKEFPFQIIGWNQAERTRNLAKLPRKFVGKPNLNYWNGRVSVQFIIHTPE